MAENEEKTVYVFDADTEISDDDLAKVAGGMMAAAGSAKQSKTIKDITISGGGKNDTDKAF